MRDSDCGPPHIHTNANDKYEFSMPSGRSSLVIFNWTLNWFHWHG